MKQFAPLQTCQQTSNGTQQSAIASAGQTDLMAASRRAPKQWRLTKTETVTSFEKWRQNLVYTLSLDVQSAHFLLDGATWLKKTKNSPLRGFTDDGST